MLSKEVSRTIFWVFSKTWPGIEPRSPGPFGEHSNHHANVQFLDCCIFISFDCIEFGNMWGHQILKWSLDGVMAKHWTVILSKRVQIPVVLCSLLDEYHWERHELFYLHSYGLDSTTSNFQQGWLWHYITYEGWYVIKQRN